VDEDSAPFVSREDDVDVAPIVAALEQVLSLVEHVLIALEAVVSTTAD
jgi:hypothetical protein